MQEIFVSLKNINKKFHTIQNETLAIENISIDVYEGEILSIVGPSGCGKSTILSIIAGLEDASDGKVYSKSKNSGFMFQKDQLYEWRTILQNTFIGLEIQNKMTKYYINKVEQMLKNYGLESFKNHYPSQLSGGMRQRAALIRTLAVEPELLLLDEPFSALDYQTRLTVGNEVGTILRNKKITTILVTHDIPEAVSISDRVILLTKRPARIKNVFNINFDSLGNDRTPLKCRETKEFGEYFRSIWKEMNIVE